MVSARARYFTGRSQVLCQLVACLQVAAGSDAKARVVTNGSRSGKSAVLARLVTLVDPADGAEIPPEVLATPHPAQFQPGSVDVTVHAAGQTTKAIVTTIAEVIGTQPTAQNRGR